KVRCSTTNWWPAPPNWAWTGSPRALRVPGRPYITLSCRAHGKSGSDTPYLTLLADRAPGIRVRARLRSLRFRGRRRCHRLWRGRHALRRLARGRLLGGGLGCRLAGRLRLRLLGLLRLSGGFPCGDLSPCPLRGGFAARRLPLSLPLGRFCHACLL